MGRTRSLSLKDETACFDFEKEGVYYKKLPDNSLMVVRRIYYRTFWKTEKHVQFEGHDFYQSYNNIRIPMEVEGMKVVSVEVPQCAPCEGIISNVTFPDTILTFGMSLMCLTNVSFPSSVKDAHYQTVACCNNLTIPNSVIAIGSIFKCNMVTIPSSVVTIQSIDEGSKVLKIDNPTPPTLLHNNANEGAALFVPQGSSDVYKNNPQWGKFKRIIEDPTLSTSVALPSLQSSSDTQIVSQNKELEGLIEAALADGVLTEKEKQILFKKAQSMGIDLDEFEMQLDARLFKLKEAEEERAKKERLKKGKDEKEKAKKERLKKRKQELPLCHLKSWRIEL